MFGVAAVVTTVGVHVLVVVVALFVAGVFVPFEAVVMEIPGLSVETRGIIPTVLTALICSSAPVSVIGAGFATEATAVGCGFCTFCCNDNPGCVPSKCKGSGALKPA